MVFAIWGGEFLGKKYRASGITPRTNKKYSRSILTVNALLF
jgi:hypothetical protein